MTQAENPYRQDVFLEELRKQKDFQKQRIWAEHQQMQISFLQRHGFTSSSTVLDIGCGPMRLGSALIPCLRGWYYGQDINSGTIAFGEVLREIFSQQAPYPCLPPTSLTSPRSIGRCNYFCQFSIQPPHAQFDLHCPFNCRPLAQTGVLYATFFARPWSLMA